MAAPRPYARDYSFAGFQSNNPNRPLPGPALDNELENIEQSLAETIQGLNDIRRPDGQLRNGIVGRDALAPDLATGVRPATLWQSGIQYLTQDTVSFGTAFYRCIIDHISAANFLDDLTAQRWELYADIGGVATDAQTARNEAVAARNEAVPAAATASAAATTATSAATIATSAATTATTQAGIATTAAAQAAASAATVINGFQTRVRYSVADGNLTNGQTVFTVPGGYDPNEAEVQLNGLTLVNGLDVDVSSGTTFTLSAAAASADVIVFKAFGVFNANSKASVAEAVAGTNDTKFMTPLTTVQQSGQFATRAEYAAWVAAGGVPVAGRTYWVGGLPFQGSPGATWTGLTGLITHPMHDVTIEHYGGGTSASGVSAATNDAAFAAWYASILSSAQLNRVLTLLGRSYPYTTLPTIEFSEVGMRGRGSGGQTILLHTGTTGGGLVLGPAEGVATGNNQFGNFLEGIYLLRSTTTSGGSGTGLTWRFCAQPRIRNVRVAQFYNQMEVIACQDEDFSDVELYAPFYIDYVAPARANSFCLRVRQGLRADTTYQAKWQSRLRGFNISGSWNTENSIILQGGDGSMYSDGYVNGGRNALILFNGDVAYGSSNYNSSHFSNVYLDGGRPDQEIAFCLDFNDTTGNYLHAIFVGGVIANCKTCVSRVRGTNNMRVQFDSVLMNGWASSEAPRLWDVSNPNAKVFINNCLMQFSHRSIRLQNADLVQINGGWLFNGSNVGFTGVALETIGVINHLNVDGLYLNLFGGSTAINDAGVGKRCFSNLQGDWPFSVVPAFTFAGGNTGVTYTGTRELRYERMGPLVYIAMTLSLSAKGSSTGEARITGLPFNADAFTTYPIAGRVTNLLRARASAHIVPDVNFDHIRFIYNFDNGSIAAQATLVDTDITDTTTFRISGWYPVINAGNI